MAEQKQENNLFSIVGGDNDDKHIFFHGPITETSTFNFITNILGVKLEIDSNTNEEQIGFSNDSEKDNCNIILHLSCPGGTINHAFIMADTIKNLNVPVYCIAEGIVASAGLIPFLACKKRTMLDHASLYIHETIHSFDQVEYSDIDKFKLEAKEINNNLKDFYCKQTGLSRKEINYFFRNNSVLEKAKAKENNFINAEINEILS